MYIFKPNSEYPTTCYRLNKQPCHITIGDINVAVEELQKYMMNT